MVDTLHQATPQTRTEDTTMSKGDNRRPSRIPDEQLEQNWNKIFKKRERESVPKLVQDKEVERPEIQAAS